MIVTALTKGEVRPVADTFSTSFDDLADTCTPLSRRLGSGASGLGTA